MADSRFRAMNSGKGKLWGLKGKGTLFCGAKSGRGRGGQSAASRDYTISLSEEIPSVLPGELGRAYFRYIWKSIIYLYKDKKADGSH